MAGSTILIVDEDLASRNYVATALQKEGHHVLQAASGKEGLIAAWRDHPDIIIADPVLADLSGEELAARLRSDARTAKVPLVALSRDRRPLRVDSILYGSRLQRISGKEPTGDSCANRHGDDHPEWAGKSPSKRGAC